MEHIREISTPEQVADYLQIDRETVYRYIREGKLIASRLGRTYRVPKRSIELFLWATRTVDDISLRDYIGLEIGEFMQSDRLDPEAQEIAAKFQPATDAS